MQLFGFSSEGKGNSLAESSNRRQMGPFPEGFPPISLVEGELRRGTYEEFVDSEMVG